MGGGSADGFAAPNPTASLLLSHRPQPGKVVLILGTGKLAASRCFACLEAGIKPVVLSLVESTPSSSSTQGDAAGSEDSADPISLDTNACPEIRHRIGSGEAVYRSIQKSSFTTQEQVTATWNSIIDHFDGESNDIFAVCITDTLHSGDEPTQTAATGDSDVASSSSAPVQPVPLSSYARAKVVSKLCRRRRIPINVADKPELCDFSFPATYRFPCITAQLTSTDSGSPAPPTTSSLQVAVTTNGRGCRLAGRIRREIVSALPRNVGDAVEKVGIMRDLAKRRIDHHPVPSKKSKKTSTAAATTTSNSTSGIDVEEEDLSFDTTPLNSPVPQLTPKNPMDGLAARLRIKGMEKEIDAQRQKWKEEAEERTKRRMRWVAQISEYWPIEYLGDLKDEQMSEVLKAYGEDSQAADQNAAPNTEDLGRGRTADAASGRTSSTVSQRARSQHSLNIRPPLSATGRGKGHIYLLGSGPGHPGLLTTLAYRLLTSPTTDLVLSDKLVPSSILKLIPGSTPLEIAKKFPGNAEGAQSELIAKALKAALEEGKNVVRLKQGDPFVYGRGGEEVLAFRRAGIECTVVPGISSSIAAPAMLGIPVTQRGAADSLVLCTGVGKGGKKVKLTGYDRNRTLIVLMGVARLQAVVATLTGTNMPEDVQGDRQGPPFPPYTPIAIIERASSSDQRMVASTLDGIVEALERSGEQRPPGMMMIGWSVLSLEGEGDTSVQDDALDSTPQELDAKDRARIAKWLGPNRRWIVREGLDATYRSALDAFHRSSFLQPDLLPHHQNLTPKPPLSRPPATNNIRENGDWIPQRSESGWAPPRYTNGIPEGGWIPGEAPNQPAQNDDAYHQDQVYADIQARLKAADSQNS
ncbi:hypothetical protein BCV70DRAFT_196015 [Testicularia cyperi]|uniref:precorrin-2 dehydrogenase n=1 Tax=Testicularia cyperi TaxID=1882483 RepID=A0A317XFH5_9BASI|nr:hypothetical protein BCV70DRAFT_196015 [Testicularia cyperi]